MIHTPEDGLRKMAIVGDTTELLHAYVAVLKLAEDHANNVAKSMERFPPEDTQVIEEWFKPAGDSIEKAAGSLHAALFG